jgi:hypothetical protein
MLNTTSPKPFVFVLMPFDHDFDDIYKLGIKPACASAGAYAERVDEQIFQESILERIYNQISKADIIVADMTGRNPNVFYETGYAHALGKPVIFLTQKADDIPFDLKHYPFIVYGGRIADQLLPDLEKKVKWQIEHLNSSEDVKGLNLIYYINNEILIPNMVIEKMIEIDYERPTGYISFGIDIEIHNSPDKISKPETFEITLNTPVQLRLDGIYASRTGYTNHKFEEVKISGEERTYKILNVFNLRPGSREYLFTSFTYVMEEYRTLQEELEQFPYILKIKINESTDNSYRTIPFEIKIFQKQENPRF